MSLSCHTQSKALDISRNIPLTSLGGYNQKMHKYHEQQKVVDSYMNQKVENLIGYHKEGNSPECIQKWN